MLENNNIVRKIRKELATELSEESKKFINTPNKGILETIRNYILSFLNKE